MKVLACGNCGKEGCRSCTLRKRHQEGRKFGRTHGLRYHESYRRWSRIKERLYNPNHIKYHLYGGRGIGMLEEWKNSPKAFLDWLDENLGPKPDGHTLDRIDSDGDYEPNNLRWADIFTQNQNRKPRSKK